MESTSNEIRLDARQEIRQAFDDLQRARLLQALAKKNITMKTAAGLIGVTVPTFSRKAQHPGTFTAAEISAMATAGIISTGEVVPIFFPEFMAAATREAVEMQVAIAQQRGMAAKICEQTSEAMEHIRIASLAIEKAGRVAAQLRTEYGDPDPAAMVKRVQRWLRRIVRDIEATA